MFNEDNKSMKLRLTARKVRIKDLIEGKYIPSEKEGMKPAYLITPFGEKVSRVNLLGNITEKFESEDGNYTSITLEDGTGSIRVKGFGEKAEELRNFEVGDLVIVIGKIREYLGEIYVNLEIVRKIDDPNYENLRRLEILKKLSKRKKIIEEIKQLSRQMLKEELKNFVRKKYGMEEEVIETILENLSVEVEEDYKEKILKLIENLDERDGVDACKIIEICKLPENLIEKAIDELLENGEIFEPLPGKFKKVG